MPLLTHSTPRYRRHKASQQAVVTLGGMDHYLGPWNSKASKIEYDRLVGEWLAAGRTARIPAGATDLTIVELMARYWRFVKEHFGKSKERNNIWNALRLVRQVYGETPVLEFGPLALKSLRQRMIEEDQSRRYVNLNIGRIKRMFKWAVSEEIIPVGVYQALTTVMGLQRGRTKARETEPVQPVSAAMVEATLPHLPPMVADMVRLQRLTGARPAEICILRPRDVDRNRDVWTYKPQTHKNQHRGQGRTIFVGPRGQEILLPYLLRDPDSYCFSPVESVTARRAEQRRHRKTPLTPSQARRRPKRSPDIFPGDHYDVASYRRAIQRACDKSFGDESGPVSWTELVAMAQSKGLLPHDKIRHGTRGGWIRAASVPSLFPDVRRRKAAKVSQAETNWYWKAGVKRWSPNQLRHSAGTEIRSKFGLEAAQVVLGHSRADVTQLYAQRDLDRAAAIIREVG